MEQSKDEEERYNPFDKASINDLLKKRELAQEREAVIKEELEDYKKAVKRLFNSADGRYFLKNLVRYIGIHSFDTQINPAKLIEDRGKKRVYLELIRPFLSGSIRAEVEN